MINHYEPLVAIDIINPQSIWTVMFLLAPLPSFVNPLDFQIKYQPWHPVISYQPLSTIINESSMNQK